MEPTEQSPSQFQKTDQTADQTTAAPSAPKPKGNWQIPVAIVLAGALVAGAIYMKDKSNSESDIAQNPEISIAVDPLGDEDHLLGSPGAPLKVIEYSDFQCPFCQGYDQTRIKLMDTYGKDGKVAWAYRHFPLVQIHQYAAEAAEGSECAAEIGGENKFWDFLTYVFEAKESAKNPTDQAALQKDQQAQLAKVKDLPAVATAIGLDKAKFKACLDSGKYKDKVAQDVEKAIKAGGSGTPYSILIPSKKLKSESVAKITGLFGQVGGNSPLVYAGKDMIAISGNMPYDIMAKIIDEMLSNQ